ncbi:MULTISPECIES: hypothetical protein [unclassified Acidovorax]|uniref:hypothetical protein n=1 Tax=unclassified Acidovorax TaxID=2684926 RepID=UPI000C3C49A1|nr:MULTISPECIES: hypothetical protein [unclassified Acidovorax]PIF19387.1 hypothetical protein CLU87_3359 [Acidovorax sp. 59]PKW01585.1 hypothetical protein CLU89_1204 [Acidovorax sp. 30]
MDKLPDSSPQPQTKLAVSTITTARAPSIDIAVMGAIPALTLADLLFRNPGLVAGVAFVTLCFLFRHLGHVARPLRRTSVVLVAVTVVLLPLLSSPIATLERGVRIGALIASLLVTINLLSRSASRVPQVRILLQRLYHVHPSQRYGVLSMASQFFGGLLGLAGISMMMESAAQQKDLADSEKIAAFSAVTRGYAALSLWSPMYSNMSIVLAMYEGASWAGVLPVALGITTMFIVLGVVLDRFAISRSGVSADPSVVNVGELVRSGWPVLLAMLGFVSLMVVTSRWLAMPISAVIISIAPAAAWLLNARLQGGGLGGIHAATIQLGQDMSSFRGMAGEVMIFIASGCAGTVIGNAIPPEWTAAVGASVAGSPALACLTVSSAIVLMSASAMHPMLSSVIVGASLGPALLGLPVLVHISAVLIGWGLAIIVTPFSVVSALASRWSGIPVIVISLRANAVFVLLALGSSASVLGLVARAIGN